MCTPIHNVHNSTVVGKGEGEVENKVCFTIFLVFFSTFHIQCSSKGVQVIIGLILNVTMLKKGFSDYLQKVCYTSDLAASGHKKDV